jgi:hypothetical protein
VEREITGYVLAFEQSDTDRWISRNNNYVIRLEGPGCFNLYEGRGTLLKPCLDSKEDAIAWASRDQAIKLGYIDEMAKTLARELAAPYAKQHGTASVREDGDGTLTIFADDGHAYTVTVARKIYAK